MINVDKDWQIYRYEIGWEWWIIHVPCYGQKPANSTYHIERGGYPPCNNCHTLLPESALKKIKFIERSTKSDD